MPSPRSPLHRKLGAVLADRRRALRLTQAEVGHRLGATAQWLSQVERGHGSPSLAMLAGLCEVLGVDVYRVIEDAELPGGHDAREMALLALARQLDERGWRVLLATARELAETRGLDQ